jgi:hypothetical protein
VKDWNLPHAEKMVTVSYTAFESFQLRFHLLRERDIVLIPSRPVETFKDIRSGLWQQN